MPLALLKFLRAHQDVTIAQLVHSAQRQDSRLYLVCAQQGGGHQPLACRLQVSALRALLGNMGARLASQWRHARKRARPGHTLESVRRRASVVQQGPLRQLQDLQNAIHAVLVPFVHQPAYRM